MCSSLTRFSRIEFKAAASSDCPALICNKPRSKRSSSFSPSSSCRASSLASPPAPPSPSSSSSSSTMCLGEKKETLRVLCLHGFRTNGSIMEQQLGKWGRPILDLLDPVFVDAPYPAAGKSDVEGIFPPPYFEWFQFQRTETETHYSNLEEGVEVISNYMEKHGPFDGLIGFSQGAFLAAALAGIQERGIGLTSCPRLGFVIIISGGVLNGEHKMKNCYSKPIKCPSLHLIGANDFLQPHNEELLSFFKDPVVIRHGARHTVPRLDEKTVVTIQEFLANARARKHTNNQSVEFLSVESM